MAWNLSGRGLEICSCKTFCPCWLTADVEPDEGWCSAVLAWDSTEGGVRRCGSRRHPAQHLQELLPWNWKTTQAADTLAA